MGKYVGNMNGEFQSTLPARGATDERCTQTIEEFISIHAPREGSDARRGVLHLARRFISIHAPREGSDHAHTLTMRGVNGISIHAPREGSDQL